MIVLLLLLLVGGAVSAVCILAISLAIARWGADGQVPRERPVWMGPDASEIEDAIFAEIARRRAAAGASPPGSHPATSELARHHAHDMAVRHFVGPIDPEGVDLAARRRRLHPEFAGVAAQWETTLIPEQASGSDGIAKALLGLDTDRERLQNDPRWSLLGVGIAIEDGHCACCVVLASWWATLDKKIKGDLHPTGVALEGVVQPGTTVEQLSLRRAGDVSSQRPAVTVPGHDGRFQVYTEAGAGSGEAIELVRDGTAGLSRKA